MIWWALDDDRLATEKADLATLADSSTWLTVGKWTITDDLEMSVDISVTHQGKTYPLQMRYPQVFPGAPPMIYTCGVKLSQHQYGADGELCLEYRPDNWHPDITGAMMVTSAHNLLETEHPESGESVHALSAHEPSIARDAKTAWCRFLVSAEDIISFNNMDPRIDIPLTLSLCFAERTLVASVLHIGSADSHSRIPGSIPVSDVSYAREATVIRIPSMPTRCDYSLESLVDIVTELGLDNEKRRLSEIEESHYLLIGDQKQWFLFYIMGKSNDRQAILFKFIEVPSAAERLPISHQSLLEKHVAIVGCGSMGSKVAASLVRSGVASLTLIDGDLFFPGNLVRNELDLGGIGMHKVDALKQRLLNLNPGCIITTYRLTFGGQESARLLSVVTNHLGEVDLVVDATANARVFNDLASVATREKIPLIWSQVFAGGIGGFIARARPELDPIPLAARQQLNAWCEKENVEWGSVTESAPYETQDGDGEVLIADDADVTVIAAHTTRFVIDCLTKPNSSHFPCSVYMIGMSQHWLFDAPFDTAPISLVPEGVWGESKPVLQQADLEKLLVSHARGGL